MRPLLLLIGPESSAYIEDLPRSAALRPSQRCRLIPLGFCHTFIPCPDLELEAVAIHAGFEKRSVTSGSRFVQIVSRGNSSAMDMGQNRIG